MIEMKDNRALVIGVGADLPNTVQDANAIADILQDPGRCAYPASNVVRLTDGSEDGFKPTRDNILKALDALAANATADSTVIVYFSGHGYKIETSSDENYFLMPLGYNINQLRKTAISGREFAEKLRAIKAQRLLLLLDCCFAQGIGDAKAPGLTLTQSPLPPEATELFSQGQGRIILASSKSGEFSLAGKPTSLFTRALIECLCGAGLEEEGDGTADGYVRASDLGLYTAAKVVSWTDNMQHPDFNFFKSDNFVLAYYAGGASKPKALPPAYAKPITKEEVQQQNQNAIQILINNTNTGSGSIASGDGAIATGQGGVVITGGTVGNVVTGKQINGDYVKGDKVLGSKIGRQINTGGGVYVEGDIKAGEFVGRDKVVHNTYNISDGEEDANRKMTGDARALVELLNNYFDINDLEDLAFQLDMDWDNLRGQTKKAKARALALHCQSTDKLDNLKRIMRLARPNLRSQLS